MKHRLDRIVTKTGDSGSTSIRPNNRISKNSPIIHFLGDLDELNSFLGNLKAEMFNQCKNNPEFKKIIDVIKKIQNHIFDAGGSISSLNTNYINKQGLQDIEEWIKKLNKKLPPLEEFVLPGNSILGAKAHLARTCCRRTERSVVNLIESEDLYQELCLELILPYLNRLSDFLFVVGRFCDKTQDLEEEMWLKNKK